MKTLFLLFFTTFIAIRLFAQPGQKLNLFTQDIVNFWVAYDSVQSTNDTIKQERFIQKLKFVF